jgi:hypothetical protein
MSDDELRATILDYLRSKGRARAYEVKTALRART